MLDHKKLSDIIGIEDIKSTINIALVASKAKNDAFPHTLIYGGPGLGKTTLAKVIANERGSESKIYLSNVFRSPIDVRNLMSELNFDGYDEDGNIVGEIKPAIIFLDEIHQLSKRVQEAFFQAMEDYKFTSEEANRLNGKIEKIVMWVPRFTLVGATTKAGSLDKPFIDRFKLVFNLNLYSESEIYSILDRYSQVNNIKIENNAISEIAKRSRGVARKAINFLERSRDTAIFLNQAIITIDIVNQTFNILNIDSSGLEALDVEVLQYLYEIYPQKIGLESLAVKFNITNNILKEIIEPYLMRRQLIYGTPGGRIISENGMKYLEKNKLISLDYHPRKIGGRVTNAAKSYKT